MSRTEQIDRERASTASLELQKSSLQLWQALPEEARKFISEDEVIIEGIKNQERLTKHFQALQWLLIGLVVSSCLIGIASNSFVVAIVGSVASYALHEWLKKSKVESSKSDIMAGIAQVVEHNELLSKAKNPSASGVSSDSPFDVPPQDER